MQIAKIYPTRYKNSKQTIIIEEANKGLLTKKHQV